MRLYLIQHGEATSEQVDPLRPLTQKGQEDIIKVASFLRERGIKLALIYHSEKMRARQTAEILACTLGLQELTRERRLLLPQDDIKDLVQEISQRAEDLMIVGHLPFLNKLASFLLLAQEEGNLIAFQQGGVICLQRREDRSWQIAWMIVPQLLK